MLVRAFGATLHVIEGVRVDVEVEAGAGLPAFHIVGQADRVVNESRDRIRAAFRQCGLEFPPGRVTVNLAPTGVPKVGSALDLPIALAIAGTRVELEPAKLERALFLGELGLDGALRPVRGVLAMLGAADGAGIREVVVPRGNLGEAALCPGVAALAAESLGAALAWLRDEAALERPDARDGGARAGDRRARPRRGARPGARQARARDRRRGRAQPAASSARPAAARRCSRGACRGSCRRSSSARRSRRRASTARRARSRATPCSRVRRSARRTTAPRTRAWPAAAGRCGPARSRSRTAACCSSTSCRSSSGPVLEALRQPLEEGEIRLARSHGSVRLPARFQLVAAMNPCPCGWRGAAARECRCLEPELARYRAKLSGPLLDRIDLHVPVAPVPWREMLRAGAAAESSDAVRARVLRRARAPARRYAGEAFRANAELPNGALAAHCRLDPAGRALLERAVGALGLSMRGFVRSLRLARTLADLDGADAPGRRARRRGAVLPERYALIGV